jgi:hypothetical protein
MISILGKYIMLNIVIKIWGLINPAKYIKNYLNTIIDERVKSIIADEKIDNIVRQLTKEDIQYIKHLSVNTGKVVKTEFTGEVFNKLKRLGVINETLDYKRSNDILEKQIKVRPLESVISLTDNCREILRFITITSKNTLDENLKNATDISKAHRTMIQKINK